MNFEKMQDYRKGQFIFNFLEWLAVDKGVNKSQNSRLADTFHLSDKEFDEYYEEYLEKLGMKK